MNYSCCIPYSLSQPGPRGLTEGVAALAAAAKAILMTSVAAATAVLEAVGAAELVALAAAAVEGALME